MRCLQLAPLLPLLVAGLLLACSPSQPSAGPASSPPAAPPTTASAPAPPPVKAPPTVLASGLKLENLVAMGTDGSHVYWSSSEGRELMKVPVTGGAPVTLVSAPDRITAIAVDRASVYYFADGKIMKVAIGGRAPTTLTTDTGSITALAVDATSVFWMSWDGHVSRLMKVSTGGGKATTLATGSGIPDALAVNDRAIYWTSWRSDASVSSSTTGDGAVLSVPLAGGTPVELASKQPGPHFMAIDATHVYWNNIGPREAPGLMKAPLSGGSVTTLATGVHTSGVAVDGSRAYWSDYQTGSIMAIGLEGGERTVLADGQKRPNAIAIDAGHIYWANLGAAPGEGSIMKLSKR